MKRILYFALAVAGAAAMVCSCGNKSKKAESEAADAAAKEARLAEVVAQKIDSLPAEPVFDIITNLGIIKVKLYEGTPKHRENFARLAFSGYYDGILFHRVINGFMIQAGDPQTKDPNSDSSRWGTGGPDYTVTAEFVSDYKHLKGALAAARRGDAANPLKESSGSQFYIVQDEAGCAHLNGSYTVYGETIEGLDVIDSIAKVETLPNDRPVNDVRIIAVKLDEKLNNLSE